MILPAWAQRSSPSGSAAIWPSSSTSAIAAPIILHAKTCASLRATTLWSLTWSSAAELTQEQAKLHPGKNVITRAVGTEPEVEGDVFTCRLRRDECILLCSDGLSNEMADQEMLFEVVHGLSKSDCCQRLLHIAKNRGAPDNVTVTLAAV